MPRERQAPFVLNIVAFSHAPEGWDELVDWAHRLYGDLEHPEGAVNDWQ